MALGGDVFRPDATTFGAGHFRDAPGRADDLMSAPFVGDSVGVARDGVAVACSRDAFASWFLWARRVGFQCEFLAFSRESRTPEDGC